MLWLVELLDSFHFFWFRCNTLLANNVSKNQCLRLQQLTFFAFSFYPSGIKSLQISFLSAAVFLEIDSEDDVIVKINQAICPCEPI